MTTKQRLAWRTLALSKTLCLIAALFPLLAVGGWIFHIDLLKQFHASLPAMQPNTMLGLLLASISTFFTGGQRSRTIRAAACILAAFICLQGMVTLSEYIFGADFGIDQILMKVDAQDGHHYPGRPSPQTAANLAILGAGLLIYNIRPFRARIGQACALLAGGNAIIAMTGYLFDTHEFYGFPAISPDIGMAVNSSASFILLALAMLCSRPDEGMMSLVVSDTRSGGTARRLIWAGSLVIPLAGVLTRLGVLAGWYSVSIQVMLFIVLILGIMLRTTWQAARHAEQDELRVRSAFSETQRVNEALKEAIDERRISEAQSSGILSISADAIISIDDHQRITMFNEGAEKIFRYSVAEALGAQLETLIPERFRSVHSEHLAKILAGPDFARRMNTAIAGRRKTGEEFPADATISKIEVGGKRILTVALRDITEQKRIEYGQRLLARIAPAIIGAEDRESILKEIARLAVCEFAEYCIVDIVEENGRARRLEVASRDSSKTQVCEMLVQFAFDQNQASLFRQVLERQQPVFIEHLSLESSSSKIQKDERLALQAAGITSLIAAPLPAHERLQGAITFAVCSSSPLYGPADLGLAEEVARRAALSIENARLLLETQFAVKTRDEVLAIVSHDLKTPLATIAILTHIVCRSGNVDAEKLRDFTIKIQRSVQEMDSLIADLLDFGKIQSGTFSLALQVERLEPVLLGAIDSVRVLAEAKRQTLRLDVSYGNLRPIAVDARRIGQVMSNLLGNAVKFTPEEGMIQVSARQRENEIIVSVADDGPGIPREHLPRIFDRFWQAEENRFSGSGLGLSIARGIVQAHGGKMWAESRADDMGSLFSFSLPLERAGAVSKNTVA